MFVKFLNFIRGTTKAFVNGKEIQFANSSGNNNSRAFVYFGNQGTTVGEDGLYTLISTFGADLKVKSVVLLSLPSSNSHIDYVIVDNSVSLGSADEVLYYTYEANKANTIIRWSFNLATNQLIGQYIPGYRSGTFTYGGIKCIIFT